MNEESLDLRAHVEGLENRLSDYHECLETAVRERDELALDAAWGVSQAIAVAMSELSNLVVAGGIAFVTWKITAFWLWPMLAGLIAFVVLSHFRTPKVWGQTNSERLKDRASLAELPTWKSEAGKFLE